MKKQGLGFAEFMYGYVDGECYMVSNTVEQICAFIMQYRMQNVKIVDFLDQLEIETSMGFILYAQNQEFLKTTLLPALIPMQMGEIEAPEFVPYKSDDTED